ncbi:hypothetical protein RUM43_002860 [Polyplax serrata]|uniref:Dol-P-Glc:Glc(2)Man(9)GlcNAc(2)-PP-Dol alpha-1,2-glucosyltransferase n=1 Tax=Polyplax serrata TaxID=468196 RepID=A0AAN8Q021_POLSC
MLMYLFCIQCRTFTSLVPSIWKKPPKIITPLFLLILILLLSEFNKLEHPYLLADNRHLAFYIWKRIFGHHIIRRLIIPIHVVSSLLFYRSLQKRNHFMLTVGLLSCIFFNLTPQHLFEIRYFILPYIMWRLHLKQHPVVFIETIFFVIVNIAVIYLFLRRPFEWPNEPGVTQRRMSSIPCETNFMSSGNMRLRERTMQDAIAEYVLECGKYDRKH